MVSVRLAGQWEVGSNSVVEGGIVGTGSTELAAGLSEAVRF
jgi:hypothetical protein